MGKVGIAGIIVKMLYALGDTFFDADRQTYLSRICLAEFGNIVFGPWLDIPCHANDNHLLNNVLQHQVYVLIARKFFITLVIINCILDMPSLVYLQVFNVEKCLLKMSIARTTKSLQNKIHKKDLSYFDW